MSKTQQQKQEYEAAMQALDELCAAHRIRNNDKLREIFWAGVVHGWKRASRKSLRRDEKQEKPIKPRSAPPAALRDSRVESSAVIPDAPPRQTRDLSDAGMFKL